MKLVFVILIVACVSLYFFAFSALGPTKVASFIIYGIATLYIILLVSIRKEFVELDI